MEPELGRQGWDAYWQGSPELAETLTSVDRSVLETLREQCGPLEGKTFLEAGSGSGKISRVLAQEGASVFLVDLSDQAVLLSRSSFSRHCAPGFFLQGSIFHLPFASESFDVVWNEGVVEHFDRGPRIEIIREMARSCRRGGWVVTFAPYSGAHLYRLGKWFAERRGRWVFGREEPLPTMKQEFSEAGLVVEQEESVGFWGQVHFLSYVPAVRLALGLTRRLEGGLAFFDRFLPGYFLATVGRKI